MKFVPMALAHKVARHSLKLEKRSPTLLFGVGVVSMVGSTVLACRSTLKLEEVLAKAEKDTAIADTLEHEDYSEQDRQRDKTIIIVRTGVEIVKLYGPSIILGVAGIGCLTRSHNMLQQRNAALTAAYVALDKGFKQYRDRVVGKYGENVDREMRYGTETVEIKDEESGRTRKLVRVSNDAPSMYARFFDQLSPSWNKEPEYNLLYLRCQQNYANDLLKSRGHVFLNEVYQMLGIPHSKPGAVVGWCLNSPQGDKYIDFGIFDGNNQVARDFVNGREGAILLDFNVDGLIFELIEDQDRLGWQS